MPPLLSSSNETDHPLGNSKHLSDVDLAILASSIEGDDGGDIGLCELGTSVLTAKARIVGSRSSKGAKGMPQILGLGTGFQVGEPIVTRVPIEVIDLQSCRNRSIEGFPDQSMGERVFADAILAEMVGHVSPLLRSRGE